MAGVEAGPESGFSLAGARELLLPVTVMVCFALYYLLGAPAWSVFAVAVPMVMLYVLAPSWAAHSVASFDRDLVTLLSTGRRTSLLGRYARAIGMRWFAPVAVRAERRALVAAENGRPTEARAAYRVALREQGKKAPLRVLLGYAHACYALADDAEAIRVYRELLDHAGSLPGVRRNLAHALVRHGDSLREALRLIEIDAAQDTGAARADERALLRAIAHAKLGEREQAQQLLDESRADGEPAAALRREAERALDEVAVARPQS